MDRQKAIYEHYRKTHILGAYETAELEQTDVDEGRTAVCFTDTEIDSDDESITKHRVMDVEGRRFRVCSVFSSAAQLTPTDKLLSLIDAELEKDSG